MPVATTTPLPATATHVPPDTTVPKKDAPRGDYADPLVVSATVPPQACVADFIEFTVVITNRGTKAAEEVVVTELMPEQVDVIDVVATRGVGEREGQAVVITIGSVETGESITIHTRIRIREQSEGPVTAQVRLTTSSSTDDPTNNMLTADINSLQLCITPTATLLVPHPVSLPPTGTNLEQEGLLRASVILGLLLMLTGLFLRHKARRTEGR